MPQRAPKVKPQPKSKYRRSSQEQLASTPPPVVSAPISVHTSPPASSPPPSSPDVNSFDGLPLMILPAPARTGIVVPSCALSHLQTLSTPPSDDSRQQMQQQAIRQGFRCEELATGAHCLLANPPAGAEPTPLADSGAYATTYSDPGLQHSTSTSQWALRTRTRTRMRMG